MTSGEQQHVTAQCHCLREQRHGLEGRGELLHPGDEREHHRDDSADGRDRAGHVGQVRDVLGPVRGGEAADAVDGGVEPVQEARRVVEAVIVDRGQDQLRGDVRVGGLVGGGRRDRARGGGS